MKVITHGESGDITTDVPVTGQAPKGVFAVTNNITSNENGDYANDDFIFGSPTKTVDGDGYHPNATRVVFDKATGSFLAGRTDHVSYWSNVGLASAVFGHDCTATGTYSFAYGGYCSASGYQALAGGWKSSAKGFYSIAIGNSCETSSGTAGIALGDKSIASHHASIAMGTEAKASSQRAVALGNQAEAHIFGMYAFSSASDVLHGTGYNQHSRLIPFTVTTDATPTVLDIFDALILPASSMWGFKGFVTALQLNGLAGAMYEIKGAIRRDDANNTTLDYQLVTLLYDNITVGGVVVQANDTLESLEIVATGKASTSIRWTANIEITQSKHF